MKQPLLKTLLACTLIASASIANAQSNCSNIDFEDSTLIGWLGATGINSTGVLTPITWTAGFISNGNNADNYDVNGRHTIITVNQIDSMVTDPITNLPDTQFTTLAPNGGIASVRLGNAQPGQGAEKMWIPYAVTAQTSWLQYQFASLQEDPNHPWSDQPYFLVNVYDVASNVVTTLCDTMWAGDMSVPFIHSGNNFSYLYRRWTQKSIDLSAFIGTTVTIEFVNADCDYGGHFGYTYIDVSCFGTGIPNVWPGDADYDLQANNVDVLTLGVAYGATGTARAGATTNWQAEASADWTQAVPLGANYKHADTNGDGIVDINDTLAISLNYGQSHTFRLQQPVVDPLTAPVLYLDAVNDTVAPGGIILVDVYLANAQNPVSSLYGIAYTLDYDNTMVQSGSVSADFNASVLGVKNSNMFGFSKDVFANGETGVAQCRFDHNEYNGYGYLGRFQMTAGNVTTLSTLHLDLSDVKAINAQMVNIPVATLGTPVVIDPAAGVTTVPAVTHIGLYPNPANESVIVSTEANQIVEITNTLGQVVYSTTATGTSTTIDLSAFEAGVYFVSVSNGSMKITEQLIVE